MLKPLLQKNPPGLVFDRALGHDFKPCLTSSGQMFWASHLMALIRRCPELAIFLPAAEFTNGGGKVIFSRYSGDEELLSQTVALGEGGATMPEAAFQKLQAGLAKFKELATQPGLNPDEARFIQEFKLPDSNGFPSAYRILKAPWYTSDRIFVLWGLEPSTAAETPVIKIVAADRRGEQSAAPPRPTGAPGGLLGGVLGALRTASSSTASRGTSTSDSRPGTTANDTNSGRSRWAGCLRSLLVLLLLLLLLFALAQCVSSCSDGQSNGLGVSSVDSGGPSQRQNPPAPDNPPPAPLPDREKPLPSPAPAPGPDQTPKPEPKPEDPKPVPLPYKPPVPHDPAPPWWKPLPQPQNRGGPYRIFPDPSKPDPRAPGQFEVYIVKPAELIQRPPAADVHLGLRYNGPGSVSDIIWHLPDGTAQKGPTLDELVPFDRNLTAASEIWISFTWIDENGTAHPNDGFGFWYVMEGEIKFKERIEANPDSLTPDQRKMEQEKDAAKKALDKGA